MGESNLTYPIILDTIPGLFLTLPNLRVFCAETVRSLRRYSKEYSLQEMHINKVCRQVTHESA